MSTPATLNITEIRDTQNTLLMGAAVIALFQTDFNGVVRSAEGVDFPATTWLRCNVSSHRGHCNIEVPNGSGPITVAFVLHVQEVGGGIHCNI